ncbi:MAG: Mur ligase family protein [Holophagaceae bacterium]
MARPHATGAELAFPAPADQLFTATEVNEWAWQQALEGAGEALPRPHAPGHPALWDEAQAFGTLRALAAAEGNPALRSLLDAARARRLPVLLDDGTLSLGSGVQGRSWPLEALPAPAEVPWEALGPVPTALVTGSNGKTTTVRLLAALASAQGLVPGHCCTDGVVVGGDLLESGDYSGPGGARAVLRHPAVQAAILETARGGILRRGLAMERADVAVVTNISADHFGEYGIHSLEDLADVKLVVARALGPTGLLVLNADDPVLAARAIGLGCPVGWFAADLGHPRLAAGNACGVRDGRLVLRWRGQAHDLGAVRDLPLSAGGHAAYNVANLAASALAAAGLGLDPGRFPAVLAAFGRDRRDNPGRLETWRMGGLTIFMDYAHNPEGLAGLLGVARALLHQGEGSPRGPGAGRLGLLLSQAGNREDDAIRALAATAAAFHPDLVILKDLAEYLRGREHGEVPAILAEELSRRGLGADRMRTVVEESDAVGGLLAWARPGDVLVMPIHGPKARAAVAEMLDGLASMGWVPGSQA